MKPDGSGFAQRAKRDSQRDRAGRQSADRFALGRRCRPGRLAVRPSVRVPRRSLVPRRRCRLRLARVRGEPSRLLARLRDCAHTIEPLVELPAYSTIIGATFYPEQSIRTVCVSAAHIAAGSSSRLTDRGIEAPRDARRAAARRLRRDERRPPGEERRLERIRRRSGPISSRASRAAARRASGRATGIAVGSKG